MDRTLSKNLVDQCSTLCFEAAHELINMIHANLDLHTVTGPVPAWWFAVLCKTTSIQILETKSSDLFHLVVYTAATVLLAEQFKPSNSSTPLAMLEPWPVGSEWGKAIELLKAYAQVGEWAERCVAALEILSSKIHGQPSHQDERATATSTPGQGSPHQHDASYFRNLENADMPPPIDLGDMDFDVGDMLWLNSSAADILF